MIILRKVRVRILCRGLANPGDESALFAVSLKKLSRDLKITFNRENLEFNIKRNETKKLQRSVYITKCSQVRIMQRVWLFFQFPERRIPISAAGSAGST